GGTRLAGRSLGPRRAGAVGGVEDAVAVHVLAFASLAVAVEVPAHQTVAAVAPVGSGRTRRTGRSGRTHLARRPGRPSLALRALRALGTPPALGTRQIGRASCRE